MGKNTIKKSKGKKPTSSRSKSGDKSKSESRRSKSESSNSDSSNSCKDDKCKDLKCKARIGVDLDVIPEVRCSKGCTREGEFKVAVRAKSNITCCIEPIKTNHISNCEGECVFLIRMKNDVKFTPEVLSECKFPTAYADLDIKAKAIQRC